MSAAGAMPDLSRAMHVVIDMQRLFADHPDWAVKDLGRIRAEVLRLAEKKPGRTFWTRFVPAENTAAARGSWRRYYEQWPTATLEGGGRDYVDLIPEHRLLAGKAAVFDKPGFSAFTNYGFVVALRAAEIDTLILSGVETDICVWATALDAIDAGFFVILARDAMTSGSLEAHAATLDVIAPRYAPQLAVMDSATLDAAWK
ncbi:MAG TPA: isochorismatase family cysteine hydrolase [Dongiaceae bacterium]|nr:isochorismatase family cysteine hydrolase [Dongiaceae bacterium]